VAVAGVDLKLSARYRLGVEPGVLHRTVVSASPCRINVGALMEPRPKPRAG
jgi:hypothetical protein